MTYPLMVFLIVSGVAWLGLTACAVLWMELRDRDSFDYVPVKVTERGRK